MTKKKRLMIALSDEDLRLIEELKVVLHTKQISKVISYLINYRNPYEYTDDE